MDGEKGVNWRRVGLFLGLTFGLSWLLNAVLWLTVGYGPRALVPLQFQMMIPGLSAIVLGMFVFKDSALYQARVQKERTRFFFYYYIACALFYLVASVAAMITQQQGVTIAINLTAQILLLLSTPQLIITRVVSGREACRRVGLGGGRWIYWLWFSLGTVAFYAAQTGLNAAFDLGQAVDPRRLLAALPAEQTAAIQPEMLVALIGLQSVVLGPVLALLAGFGEEYGWRGFLQNELIKLGRIKGTLLVGAIWGIWHAPVIAMGHNYPGYPVIGILLMIGYSIALAFVLGHAALRSGGTVLPAYLHALNNQAASFLIAVIYTPSDPVLSFGIGVYALLSVIPIVLLLFLDPIWRRKEAGANEPVFR